MKIFYFASIRQIIGLEYEELSIKEEHTINQIIDLLKKKGKNYVKAFKNLENIKCSVNCHFEDFDKVVSNKDEIAFFPPVTGG